MNMFYLDLDTRKKQNTFIFAVMTENPSTFLNSFYILYGLFYQL